MLVAFLWELTKETIHLPLGCLQGGSRGGRVRNVREGVGEGAAPLVVGSDEPLERGERLVRRDEPAWYVFPVSGYGLVRGEERVEGV